MSENGNFPPITEDLPRLLKVTVMGSLSRQMSPQPRLNLLRPRAPLALPQPSRLPPPCGMALRPRVTRPPTRYVSGAAYSYSVTVRRQCHIRSPVYGTILRPPHSSSTGKLYWTDLATVPPPFSPLNLPPRKEMTHQPGRQFRGVGTLAQATRTCGCSVPLAIAPPTDMLPLAWVPRGSVQAWSACLLSTDLLLMTAVVMQTPK